MAANKLINEKQMHSKRFIESNEQHVNEINHLKMLHQSQINELIQLNESQSTQLKQIQQERDKEKEYQLNLFAEKLDSKLNEEYLLLIQNHRQCLNRLIEGNFFY